MRRRRVAIVYTHPLLGRGIASLLETEPRVEVVTLEESQWNAAEELRRFQPQVLIVERMGRDPALGALASEALHILKRHLLILLSMKDPGMHFLRRHRLCRQDLATPDDLMRMVLGGCR